MSYRLPAGDGLCVREHLFDPERPRLAVDGLHLCAGCVGGVDRMLAQLPDLVDDLERALVPGSSSGPKISGSPDKALPYNNRAGEARRVLLDGLASWTRIVAEERGHALPADRSPSGQAAWQRMQLASWTAAQPWIDEYATNLRENVRAGRAALAEPRTKAVPLGACPDNDRCDVLTTVEQRCPGVLTAVLDMSEELLPATVTCTGCGRAYSARDLPDLGQRLTGGHSWLTTAQAAAVLGLSQDATRLRAFREGWWLRDAAGVRPRRWNTEDVDASQKRQRESA